MIILITTELCWLGRLETIVADGIRFSCKGNPKAAVMACATKLAFVFIAKPFPYRRRKRIPLTMQAAPYINSNVLTFSENAGF